MKKISLLALVALLCFSANAQSKDGGFKFAVGPVVSFPTTTPSSSSFGIGAEIEGSYGFSETFEGFAQAGYTNFIGKDLGGGVKYSTGFIPVLVGARYNASGFTVGAGVGYGSFSPSGFPSSGGFAYSPQVGYTFGKVEVIGHYTAVSQTGGSSSIAGLKLFYKF